MGEICVIDPICKNNEHFMFNLSLLKYFSTHNSDKKANFFCYESNNLIIDECRKLNVTPISKKDYSSSHIKRVSTFFFNVFYSGKVLRSKKIVLLAIDNTVIPLLFILNLFLLPFFHKKIVIISHNNLYTLKTSKGKRILFKIFLTLYQPKIIFLSPCFADEFREKIYKKNIYGYFHQNFQNIISNLYTIVNKKKEDNNNEYSKVILVSKSYVGFFLSLFNDNYEKFNDHNLNTGIKVKYISDVELGFLPNASISFERVNIPKDMETYFNLINASDFVFLPENFIANHRASGVLMDSLSLKTNFIAPAVGHFKDIYDKYNIGFVYNNPEEFVDIINEILNNKIKSDINENHYKTLISETDSDVVAKLVFN